MCASDHSATAILEYRIVEWRTKQEFELLPKPQSSNEVYDCSSDWLRLSVVWRLRLWPMPNALWDSDLKKNRESSSARTLPALSLSLSLSYFCLSHLTFLSLRVPISFVIRSAWYCANCTRVFALQHTARHAQQIICGTHINAKNDVWPARIKE